MERGLEIRLINFNKRKIAYFFYKPISNSLIFTHSPNKNYNPLIIFYLNDINEISLVIGKKKQIRIMSCYKIVYFEVDTVKSSVILTNLLNKLILDLSSNKPLFDDKLLNSKCLLCTDMNTVLTDFGICPKCMKLYNSFSIRNNHPINHRLLGLVYI